MRFKLNIYASVIYCLIDIKTLNQNHPLFLNKDSIIYPENKTTTLRVNKNNHFELYCPGRGKVQTHGLTFHELAKIKCLDGNLAIDGHKIDVSKVVCSEKITSFATYTSRNCWKKYKELEIRFLLPGNKFVKLITVCFDDKTRNVIYSAFELTKNIGSKNYGNRSTLWIEGNFYNLSSKLNNIYPKVVHRVTLNRQIGLPDDDDTYIKQKGDYYIARGHLAANADFVYVAQQQATFYYINSIPQWQTLNGKNWMYMEKNLRRYVAQNYIDLIVYTGTYGISTLPHNSTGRQVKLYLFQDKEEKAIPIPELLWKVAYDPISKAGVAVLGINNPYQSDISKSIICKDISSNVSWLDFELKNIAAGYMYACTVTDFRQVVDSFPNMKITKLLT